MADAHNNLGIALFRRGRLDEAIASYHQALRLRPADAQASNNLATALRMGGRLNEAVAAYRQAIELAPTMPNCGTTWAACWIAAENWTRRSRRSGRRSRFVPRFRKPKTTSETRSRTWPTWTARWPPIGGRSTFSPTIRRRTAIGCTRCTFTPIARRSRFAGNIDIGMPNTRPACDRRAQSSQTIDRLSDGYASVISRRRFATIANRSSRCRFGRITIASKSK